MNTISTLQLNQDVKYNLVINRNRDLDVSIQCEVYSGDSFIGYFDFTPYTGATLQAKVKCTDSFSPLTFSTTDGSIELLADGVFKLVKPYSDLKIRAGEYFYDMYLTSVSANKRAFLSGNLIVEDSISS